MFVGALVSFVCAIPALCAFSVFGDTVLHFAWGVWSVLFFSILIFGKIAFSEFDARLRAAIVSSPEKITTCVRLLFWARSIQTKNTFWF